ncbi:MAG: hypothetical protein ACPHHQ_00630, partial [Pseudomonadales bacterium]
MQTASGLNDPETFSLTTLQPGLQRLFRLPATFSSNDALRLGEPKVQGHPRQNSSLQDAILQ